MAEQLEVYKCEVCGNIVLVLHGGAGELVCCNQPMVLQDEQTEDSSVEKHVPYIASSDDGVVVKIGENETHPMQDEHYIEWIEVQTEDRIYRKFLQPGDEPKAEFCVPESEVLKVREYCNVHNLWST